MIEARILSLNVGEPKTMEWNGRSILSSMEKLPIAGRLNVRVDGAEGDKFASPQLHGTLDSALYAFGMPSLLQYMRLLGRDSYVPGSLGENLTLDTFDEEQISVGDVFAIGDEIEAQATFPRIPCGKVNIRMRHEHGQRLLQEVGRSGVYFRVLKPGSVGVGDVVRRIRQAAVPFPIPEIYRKTVANSVTAEDMKRIEANGYFPERFLMKQRERFSRNIPT